MTLRTSVPLGAVTSVDFPAIERGGRYLVSGHGDLMWACGFTRAWSAPEADAWARALRD